jgi:uncharacterized protein YacL
MRTKYLIRYFLETLKGKRYTIYASIFAIIILILLTSFFLNLFAVRNYAMIEMIENQKVEEIRFERLLKKFR